MKTHFFYDFFYYFSKIVIFFPLVLIIFGLILKFNQKQENFYVKNIISPTKIFFSPTSKTLPIKLDLQGPWRCLFNDEEATITAYIKDRKIKIKIQNNKENSYFLIHNDCFYQWSESRANGEKSCGLSPYLNFAESILKNNQNMFFDLFFKQFKEFKGKSFSFENICKKDNVDENIFLVPTTILFKNKPLKL